LEVSDSTNSFLSKFNQIAEECSVFRFVTRDTALQEEASQKLRDLLAQTSVEKKVAAAGGDEDRANALLGCECAARALIAEIKMWILLKEGRPDDAWDELIEAQSNTSAALQAHDGFQHFDVHIRRLEAVERIVFPPQVFLSAGMVVRSQICSICGQDYEDCQHVKGRPYMGEFCVVSLVPSKVNEVSIVESPADKRCRILTFSVEGGHRNRMTWKVGPGNGHAEKESTGLTSEVVVATPGTFAE
jgi:hypothetical protein